MGGEVTVIAVMKVAPDGEERALEILHEVIASTHEEEGCVKYTLHKDTNQPGAYCIVEKWRSQADLDAHFGQPHMAPLAEAVDLLSEAPQIFFCEQVEVGESPKAKL